MEQKTKENFFSKYGDYLILSAIIFVVFNFALLLNGVFPYGSNTILVSDAYEQLGAYFSHIFDFLSGKSSLFYTNKIGGGIEIFSTLEYMFINPFYLLILPFGKANILKSFSLSLLACLVFNGIVFLWFTKKHFKNVSKLMQFILSLFFVFGLFANLNVAFMTWLVYPALALLVVDAFFDLCKTGKTCRFVVLMTIYVCACFSTGIVTNLVLLPIFVLYLFLCKEKQERNKILCKLFFAYLIAAFVSIIVLFPAIFSIFSISRVSDKFLGAPKYIISKYVGLFFDSAILIFAILYICFCDKKDKFNKFLIGSAVLCVSVIVFDYIQRLMCGGTYNGFANRFSFLYEVAIFVLTLEFFDKKPLKCSSEVENKLIENLIFFATCFFAVIFIVFEIMNWEGFSSQLKNPINTATSSTLTYLCLFAIMSLIVFLTLFFERRKTVSKNLVKKIFAVILSFSLLSNVFAFSGSMCENDCNYNNRSEVFEGLSLNDGKLSNDRFYNIFEDSANFSGAFSSMLSQDAVDTYSYFTQSTSNVLVNGTGTNLLADCLLGNKYILSEYELDRPYLSLISSNEFYFLYENNLATSGAFLVDESFEFDSQKTYIQNIKALATLLGESDDFVQSVDLEGETQEIKDKSFGVSSMKKYTFTASEDGILYAKGFGRANSWKKELDGCKAITEKEELDGKFYTFLAEDDAYIDISFINKDETIVFYMISYAEDILDNVSFEFLKYDSAKSFCEKLKENECKNFLYTKDGYSFDYTATEKSKICIFNVDILGMNYTIDGEKVDCENMLGKFLTVSVEVGSGKFVAKYDSPYKKIWIAVSIVCLCLAVIIIILLKKNITIKFEKFASGAMIILTAAVLVVLFGGGILLSLVSLFM